MKKCPYCAEEIQDSAIKCRYCDEFLDQAQRIEIEPTLEEQRKWAEIRRLQRIAWGGPSRADNMSKTKGLLSVVIIIGILFYAYQWNQKYRQTQGNINQNPLQSSLTFEEINTLFGPDSPFPPSLKQELFLKHKEKRVVWRGHISYINLGQGNDLFMTVRHVTVTQTAGVQVRFRQVNRSLLEDLQTGQEVTYSGQLVSYDESAHFFSLRDGAILKAPPTTTLPINP